jgi:hypothetical protein
MRLIDRNELGAESEADDRNINFFLRHDGVRGKI